MHYLIRLSFCLFLVAISVADELPGMHVDSDVLSDGNSIRLNGEWWFTFGEQIPVRDVPTRIQQQQMDIVSVPEPWNDAVADLTESPYQHGVATYALPLTFSEIPDYAVSINVSYIGSSYRLYWLPEGEPNAKVIATSGDWREGRVGGLESDYYHFPAYSDGLLIAHVAKANVFKGGIRQPISLQKTGELKRSIEIDWIIRSALIGGLFIMAIHYLVQYHYSRESISAFYLALVCFIAVLRSLSAAGYLEIFLFDVTQYHYQIRLRTEYLSLILAPVAFFLFLSSMVTGMVPNWLKKLAIISSILAAVITFSVSAAFMSKHLTVYQLFLLFWSFQIIAFTLYGAVKRLPFSGQMLASTSIIALGTFNDLIASRSALYNIYIVEFSLALFLFLQAHLVGQQLRFKLTQSVRLTEEKKALETAHTKAVLASQQDHLTGLFNRLALTDKTKVLTEISVSKCKNIGVILFDIDNFKRINDTYGHDVGDEILIFIASLMHGHALRSNDFKCRYGGEEFLILLPDSSLANTKRVAEELRERLEHAVAYASGEVTLKITASFGVALYQERNMEPVKDVISRADEALYRAKEKGRNRVEV